MDTVTTSDAAIVRVLLVDDEELMRSGLRLMIDGARGIEVVGEAADGAEAVARARELEPDVVLMDVRMPGMDGIEATARLRGAGCPAAVVVLTAFDADGYLVEALRAGAVSFLLKDSAPEVVVSAVLDAVARQARFSPAVLERLVRIAAFGPAGWDGTAGSGSAGPSPSRPTRDAPRPEGVTDREWEVGRLVSQGLTNSEIADALFLSVPTIKTHLGRLFDKLAVTNRVQLAIRVLERER